MSSNLNIIQHSRKSNRFYNSIGRLDYGRMILETKPRRIRRTFEKSLKLGSKFKDCWNQCPHTKTNCIPTCQQQIENKINKYNLQ